MPFLTKTTISTMITELALSCFSLVLFYLIYEYKKLHYHFAKWGIKFKPGVPIFGNTFRSTFAIKHLIEDIDVVYKAFPNERYVGFIEGMKPVILVRDPELMKSITIKDFDHFVNRKVVFPKEIEPLLGSSLLNMKGDEWHKMRCRLTGAFTGSKMRCMMPFMMEISNRIVDYLKGHQSKDIDVLDLMRRYNTDVIASTGFGLHVDSIKDKNNEFISIGQKATNFTFWRQLYYFLTIQFPAVAKIMQFLGIELLSSQGTEFFRKIVADTIAYREKNNVVRPDFIHLLMETSQDLTLDEITGQIYFAFMTSYEITSTTLTLCIHELALHPHIQEKLYQEIIEKQEKFGELTYECISESKYLDCVLQEVSRKWSSAVMMDRVCTKLYVMPPPRDNGSPYVIHPGDLVYNLVNSVQMDEQHHPEPDTFDPDRFSDKNKQEIEPFTYMPFGMGPRNCIGGKPMLPYTRHKYRLRTASEKFLLRKPNSSGMRYALLTMKVLLYHLILNYQIVRCKRTADPLRLQPVDFSVRAEGDTYVRFECRT